MWLNLDFLTSYYQRLPSTYAHSGFNFCENLVLHVWIHLFFTLKNEAKAQLTRVAMATVVRWACVPMQICSISLSSRFPLECRGRIDFGIKIFTEPSRKELPGTKNIQVYSLYNLPWTFLAIFKIKSVSFSYINIITLDFAWSLQRGFKILVHFLLLPIWFYPLIGLQY